MTKLSMAAQNFVDASKEGAAPPPLYATTKRDFSARTIEVGAFKITAGTRVRVVRLYPGGDIGITTSIEQAKTDDARAVWSELQDFSEKLSAK